MKNLLILEASNNTKFSKRISYDWNEREKKKEKKMHISLFKQISFLVSPGRKWSAASGKGNSYKTKRRKGVIYSLNSDINFGLQPNAWWAVKSSFKPKGTRNPLRTIPGSLSYSLAPWPPLPETTPRTVFERWILAHLHDRLLPARWTMPPPHGPG